MPWSTSDVNRFKQGLNQEQKKKWVSIANSVLRKCRQENGKNCEQKAIRTANSQVTTNMMETQTTNIVTQSVAATSYQIRTEQHQGREHIVVPVVMMVEGVHNGSRGPLFHSAQELGSVVAAWNGIPIVINHPQDADGNFMSANSPDQAETVVGRVYNSRMEDGKLKAEAWLDTQTLTARSQETLAHIHNQNPLEVSVGVFTEEEEQEGEWNGEHYTAIAHNHRPDHLALLPHSQGACSWQDGCGIRVNSKKPTKSDNMEIQLETLKDLNKKGFAVVPIANEDGFRELSSKVQQKLDSMDNDQRMHFLEEMYSDRVIYRVRNRETNSTTLYQVGYNVDASGKVEFQDNAQEVRRDVQYNTFSMRRTKFYNNSNSKKMGKTKIDEKVDGLILNNNSKFTDCDREFLSGLSESKLDELTDLANKQQEPTEEPKLDANTAINYLKENKPKDEDLLQLLSKEAHEAYTYGLKLYQEKRDKMVKDITTNSKAWEEKELKEMDFALLEKVAKSIKPDVDYSGQDAGGDNPPIDANTEDDEFLPIMPSTAKTEKK